MVIYEGPSKIDGQPIVAIVTFGSNNSKTGSMPQIWILRSDLHPTEALRNGDDKSICGNCIHRPKLRGADALKKHSRTCYVNTMSINAVYKKYAKGGYKKPSLDVIAKKLSGTKVRLGAYGDPAAVPIAVWDTILKYCTSTGYTHQWLTCEPEYSNYVMASCDTIAETFLAKGFGYRSFFVQNVASFDDVIRQQDDIKFAYCPASKELQKTTCYQCMACSGNRSNLHSNITIKMH